MCEGASQSDLTAIDARLPASLGQSADMTNECGLLKLHRCSNFEGTTSMKSLPGDYPDGCRSDVMGCTGNRVCVQIVHLGQFSKLKQVGNHPLQGVKSEHFVSGVGCDGFVHTPELKRYMLY